MRCPDTAKKAKCFGACLAGALGLVLALVAPYGVACAQELDPFQTNSSVWKSFDRYKEEQKDKLLSEMTGNLDADTKAAAERDAAESQESQSEPQNNTADTTNDKKTDSGAPPVAQ